MHGDCDFYAERNLYRVTSAVTRGLIFAFHLVASFGEVLTKPKPALHMDVWYTLTYTFNIVVFLK
jgi:hypothetical protein